MEQQETSFVGGGNAIWFSHFGRVWQYLIKLDIISLYDPGIHLGIYPNELKIYVHSETST